MDHVARVVRLVDAPCDRVWRALTGDELATWYWPARFETEALVEAWPGGRLRIVSAPMGMGVSGVVSEAAAPDRLACSWRWDGEALETQVAITLAEAAGGTEVDVVHSGFPTPDGARDHERGWGDCLDRLTEHLRDG
jgi:uncharacterized protein YndB with AHSA1/START domain